MFDVALMTFFVRLFCVLVGGNVHIGCWGEDAGNDGGLVVVEEGGGRGEGLVRGLDGKNCCFDCNKRNGFGVGGLPGNIRVGGLGGWVGVSPHVRGGTFSQVNL